jgi:sulfatase modifying factor 1
VLGFACACAFAGAVFATSAPPPPSPAGAVLAPQDADASLATPDTGPQPPRGAEAETAPCPGDMVYVDTTFCPDIARRCVDMENERSNHLPICHAFAAQQTCRTDERRLAFCIDRYEYPNRKDAHPTWMLDWYKAQATCESKQKRLCWASEWTAACEGPEHTPFPYGWARDHDACNMDNFYIGPRRPGPKAQFLFYSKDPDVAVGELSRLDQSVASGSIEACKSGFGVYDMTGNFDEWVVSDQPPREKSRWAGLKGGAWGHVRSQCRPMTTSHEPEFTYYFVGFRCCRDAKGPVAPFTPSPQAIAPPAVPPHDFAAELAVAAGATAPPRSASNAKFSRTGKAE